VEKWNRDRCRKKEQR
jgi:hypothetical protein